MSSNSTSSASPTFEGGRGKGDPIQEGGGGGPSYFERAVEGGFDPYDACSFSYHSFHASITHAHSHAHTHAHMQTHTHRTLQHRAVESTGPFETGPFETGPFETGPFETGPFETGPFRTVCASLSSILTRLTCARCKVAFQPFPGSH